jgi:DNA-binding CsgD family transcriptional regulator
MSQTVIGREPELARIVDFIGRMSEGVHLTVIDGEAGIGKSTLWLETLDMAVQRSWRVISAQPTEVEASFAFAGLGDLLEATNEGLLRRLPVPQQRALRFALLRDEPDGPPPDNRAVAVALLGVLRLLAEGGPVLLAVDDVQWLDPASSMALAFAIRRLRDEPIGILLARRVESAAPMPLGLDRWAPDRVDRIVLGPMGPAAIRRLVLADLGVGLPRPALRRIHASSGGNPFVALELARAVASSNAELNVWMDIPATSELSVLLEQRLAALPSITQDALAVAAALPYPTIETVSAVEGVEADSWLDPAMDARVLEVRDERIAFTHPLLASAAHSRTSARRRREIHAVLATLVDDPEEQARHLALATQAPAEFVAHALEDAAKRAYARGAPDAACNLAAEARRRTPVGQPTAALRRSLAEAEYATVACDMPRARAVLETILESSTAGAVRSDVLSRLAAVATRGGDWQSAPGLWREALAENHDDDRLRARIEFGLGSTLDLVRDDIVETIAHLRVARELAERVGDDATVVEALSLEAKNEQRLTGRMPTDMIDRALAREAALPPDRWDLRPTDLLAGMLSWTDELPRALALWEDERMAAADHGFIVALSWILARMIVVEVLTGAWDQAIGHADEAVELAIEGGQVANQAVIIAGRALVTAHLGEVETTRSLAAEALQLSVPSGAAPARRTAAWALGLLELSLARPAQAHDHLSTLVEEARSAGIAEPGELTFVPDEVEALIGLGRLAEAESLLDWFEGLAAASHRRGALGASGRCRGSIHAARGDLAQAQSVLERAVAQFDGLSRPFELARTLLVLGRTQRHALRKTHARSSLEAAVVLFDELGARLWSEMAKAELASIGGRMPAGDALTSTEQRVAALVAEGRTNREVAAALFLTDRTVEGHLTRIYAKLQIRSRSELAHRFASSTSTPVC